MPLAAGTRLGVFEILAPLGKGGMGEVYRAKDTKLEREVAVKILPEEMAKRPERMARFEREAKLLAALDHPHIAAIHGLHEEDGQHFLVMELVEGQTLADRLRRGPLPVREALDLGRQIAEALEAGHEKGIIHRDLKPSNVMLTSKGKAKVVDFGLGRLLEQEAFLSGTETETTPDETGAGVVVGTAPYMSPEQARGEDVDRRTDIWAFGCVLFEMLTGKRAFPGATWAEAMAAVLDKDPDWSTLPAEIPPIVRSLLRRCLEKNDNRRLRDIADARIEMEPEGLWRDLEASRERSGRWRTGVTAVFRRSAVALPTLVLILAGLAALVQFWQQSSRKRWAREEALPAIERLVEDNWQGTAEAYALALEAKKHIPDDPRLAELIARCSWMISVTTEPPGADVYVKPYASPDAKWQHLGASPLENVRVPIEFLRWKIDKPGYETVVAAATTWDISLGEEKDPRIPRDLHWRLDEKGTVPTGMVRVHGSATAAGPLEDFYIDRYEVTNRQFQEFVNAGGYRERRYWTHDFIEGEDALAWKEAMARFVDETDRPGPSTWVAGSYPDDQADYPVSGISWYEAAAYAKFANKALPTGFHWHLARGGATPHIRWAPFGYGFAILAPFSNFDGRGPRAVGSLAGLTAFGAYDMAGNVREWCFNETRDARLVRGGSWSDETYMFIHQSQLSPMDRSPQNGFRCAFYPEPEKIPDAAFERIELRATRDFYAETPVPDEIFRVFKERFSYDRTDLDARVDSRQEGNEHWIHETVSYDAAYGEERILAHLFLPRSASPPYQTVIYFPGSGSVFQRSSAKIEEYLEFTRYLSFIVKNGRAVLYPVYKGTFERHDPSLAAIHGGEGSHRYTEYLVQLVKDSRRSIDYLETRDDIATGKLAYLGLSWGGALGAIIPAVEDRLQASVLIAGGLPARWAVPRPEADPLNYVSRVPVPTLMINGRYDTIYPLEKSIRPMFDLLGTPAGHKELLLFETDHVPRTNEIIRGTLSWLDRHLGPVGGPS